MSDEEIINKAIEAGYQAALCMLKSLQLTDEEVTEVLLVSASVTAFVKVAISNSVLEGYKIRPDLCVSAALACSLAGLNARDTILKENGIV
jgi:hypothetical protein